MSAWFRAWVESGRTSRVRARLDGDDTERVKSMLWYIDVVGRLVIIASKIVNQHIT